MLEISTVLEIYMHQKKTEDVYITILKYIDVILNRKKRKLHIYTFTWIKWNKTEFWNEKNQFRNKGMSEILKLKLKTKYTAKWIKS